MNKQGKITRKGGKLCNKLSFAHGECHLMEWHAAAPAPQSDCVALNQRASEASRELAQWLLDHPQYSDALVAGWLECGVTRIKDLRRWAKGEFAGPWPLIAGQPAMRH